LVTPYSCELHVAYEPKHLLSTVTVTENPVKMKATDSPKVNGASSELPNGGCVGELDDKANREKLFTKGKTVTVPFLLLCLKCGTFCQSILNVQTQ
jgi:hypothetical protein